MADSCSCAWRPCGDHVHLTPNLACPHHAPDEVRLVALLWVLGATHRLSPALLWLSRMMQAAANVTPWRAR